MSRWSGGLRRALFMVVMAAPALVQTGCKSCTPGENRVKTAADADKTAAKKKKRKVPKGDPRVEARKRFKTAHPMLVEGVDPVDHTLAEPVAQAKALVLENTAEKAAEARALLATHIPDHPEDADALLWRGRSWAVENITEQAVPDFESAVIAAPEHVEARLVLVSALYAADMCAEAMPHLDTLAEQQPELGAVRYNRGLCQFQLSGRSAAIEDFAAACALEVEPACALSKRRGKGKGKGKRLKGKGKGKVSDGFRSKLGSQRGRKAKVSRDFRNRTADDAAPE